MGGGRYLFNLCVAPSHRRQGVARALLERAHAHARAMGVRVLYVHVEEPNQAGRELYESMGYELEQEETERSAKRHGHPRRRLLRLRL